MNQKVINKQAKEFARSLMEMASEMQKQMKSISESELKNNIQDINYINEEATKKCAELELELKKFENKVKNL